MENQVQSVDQAQSVGEQAFDDAAAAIVESIDLHTTEGGAPAGFEAKMGRRRSRAQVAMAQAQFWATYHRIDPAIRYTNGLTTAVMSSYSNTIIEWYDGKISNRDACFRIDLDTATLVRHFVHRDPALVALDGARALKVRPVAPVQLSSFVTVEVA